jgi:hypothetical protein
VLPRLAPDQVIMVDLKVEDAGLRVPEKGIPLGEEDRGGAPMATEITNTTLKTRLTIPSGRALAATGMKTTGPSGTGQTLIIVAPRVLDGEAHHGSP